jgi:diaminopimelate epimerase
MQIPFTKAHGAKNDFLLTWVKDVPSGTDLTAVARAICDRNTGIGADGWMLVDERPGIRLFNSDGSEPELSGNGTRCAAAFLIAHGAAVREGPAAEIEIATGAGPKKLTRISRRGLAFEFEMNMGRPSVIELHFPLELAGGTRDVTLIDCGNPQCAVPVPGVEFDWLGLGAEIERHPHFPNRTNVSFVQAVNAHTIAAVFFERGAGATMSSGTGATGAAVCAMARGTASSPVKVLTTAGPLDIEERGDIYLRGPAVIVAKGTYHYDGVA